LDALAEGGLSVKVETREPQTYASLEWFIPTALVVYIAKSYFDGFLREAGKNNYRSLKNALTSIWGLFFGEGNIPVERQVVDIPEAAPGSETVLELAFTRSEAPVHVQIDVLRPTSFSAHSLDWKP
jgi:hypothetical protein